MVGHMASGSGSIVNVRVLALLVALLADAAVAQSSSRSVKPAVASREPVPSVAVESAVARTEKAFPTGDRATSTILLERITPLEVRRGSSFSYDITLTNLTRSSIGEVTLVEQFPPDFRPATINPEPTRREGNTAIWQYKAFPGGGRAAVQIVGSTDRPNELVWCATVTFEMALCASTKIVEPKLLLTKTAPAEAIICDLIPVRLAVTNTGNGTMRGVKVTDKLPQSWQTGDGKDTVSFDAGTLKPGESREFSFQARSGKTGTFVNEATASESGGLTAQASARTVVRQPVLAVTKTGPEVRYIGRPADYRITVANTGDAPARDTMLVDTFSGAGEFVTASDNAQFANGKVTWALGTLAPGASKSVTLSLVGRSPGIIRDDAVATAYCAEARASAQTRVQGVAAILLEVVDVADPIEVGADETYIITVVNQGTAEDRNIRVTCTLPADEDFISAEGPTNHRVEGKTVLFEPVASLAPKAKLVYRVVVKGTKVEDVRFKTTLTSDMLVSPVEETESTHIY